MSGILIAMNEARTSGTLARLLDAEGYKVRSVSDVNEARAAIAGEDFDLLIYGHAPAWDPDLTVPAAARSGSASLRIIVLTSGDPSAAGALARFQPFACLGKPLKPGEFMAAVQKAVDYAGAAPAATAGLSLQMETSYAYENVVAESPAMKKVCDLIGRIAPIDVTVLIAGDDGTRKDAIAAAIHKHSRRRDRELVAVNCGASDVEAMLWGKEKCAFARAEHGTLLLRDAWALPKPVQAKLASSLGRGKAQGEHDKVHAPDVRLIATARRDLDDLSRSGAFSGELHRLLKAIAIEIPALRERPADIMPTFRHLLRQAAGPAGVLPGIGRDAVKALEQYGWPGNEAEMARVVEESLKRAKGNMLTAEFLPKAVRTQG